MVLHLGICKLLVIVLVIVIVIVIWPISFRSRCYQWVPWTAKIHHKNKYKKKKNLVATHFVELVFIAAWTTNSETNPSQPVGVWWSVKECHSPQAPLSRSLRAPQRSGQTTRLPVPGKFSPRSLYRARVSSLLALWVMHSPMQTADCLRLRDDRATTSEKWKPVCPRVTTIKCCSNAELLLKVYLKAHGATFTIMYSRLATARQKLLQFGFHTHTAAPWPVENSVCQVWCFCGPPDSFYF